MFRGFFAFRDFGPFSNPQAELHFKMQVLHIHDVLGGDISRSDPNNDRGVDHGCEEEGQEGQEGDQEEGRQEEEVIDLGQLVILHGYP